MSAPGGSPLLDLDALMPSPLPLPGNVEKDAVTAIPVYPGQNPIPNALSGCQEPKNSKAFGDSIPVIPIIPVKNTGRGTETPQVFPVSPAAATMVIAWCKRKEKDRETRTDALNSLEESPPGEQVAMWSQACQNAGILPWRVWHLKSPGKG